MSRGPSTSTPVPLTAAATSLGVGSAFSDGVPAQFIFYLVSPLLLLALAEGKDVSAAQPVLDQAEVAREFDQRSWFRENGLPDNRVHALHQTPDGYLWIATPRGLARFDGLKFTVFDRLNTPEFVSDDCWDLTEDSMGNLWVGTLRGPVRVRGNEFKRFMVPSEKLQSLCVLRPGRAGRLWAGGSAWISRIDEHGIRTYGEEGGFPAHLTAWVTGLEEDNAAQLWLASYGGLIRFDMSTEHFELTPLGQQFESLPALTMQRGQGGKYWVLFSDRSSSPGRLGAKRWLACFQDGRWIRTPDPTREDFIVDQPGAFITEDGSGAIWLPAGLNAVHRFVHDQFQLLPVPHRTEQDLVLCAFCDREGNLWMGTDASGLQRWTPRKVRNYTTSDGLANDNVWSICESNDGSVLVGTDGGVGRLREGRFVRVLPDNAGFQKDVRSVVEDRAGTVWVGTTRKLIRFDAGEVTEITLPGEWFENKIRALLPGRDGGIWIGTVRGLTHLNNGERKKYTQADGLGSNEVPAPLEDRAGDLWVGTYEGGLSRFHGANSRPSLPPTALPITMSGPCLKIRTERYGLALKMA